MSRKDYTREYFPDVQGISWEQLERKYDLPKKIKETARIAYDYFGVVPECVKKNCWDNKCELTYDHAEFHLTTYRR